MKLIAEGMPKGVYEGFTKRVEALRELGAQLMKEKRDEELYTARCSNCGATFTYSYNDVANNGTDLKCPVCSIRTSYKFKTNEWERLMDIALANTEYVKEKAELVAIADMYNVDKPSVLK